MRILVVEDDRKVASFLRQGLEEEGHTVEAAADGDAALDLLLGADPYDLIVLDVMLPKRDGFAVLKAARQAGVHSPVIMLTARDTVADKVAGLDLGADDYLAKPFAFEELLARVRALFRRGSERRAPVLRLADLTLDPATRKVERGGRRVELTTREWALLELFMTRPGRVLSKEQIAEHLAEYDTQLTANAIEVYVSRLRAKIESADVRIRTVRGFGYLWETADG